MFDIKCPNCERQLQLPEYASVQECRCPTCRTVFCPAQLSPVPEPNTESSSAADGFDILSNHETSDIAQKAVDPDDFSDRWKRSLFAAKVGFLPGSLAYATISLFLQGDSWSFDILELLYIFLNGGLWSLLALIVALMWNRKNAPFLIACVFVSVAWLTFFVYLLSREPKSIQPGDLLWCSILNLIFLVPLYIFNLACLVLWRTYFRHRDDEKQQARPTDVNNYD
jgi:hypothetical protein